MSGAEPITRIPGPDLLAPLILAFRDRWPSAEEALGAQPARSVAAMHAEFVEYERRRDELLGELHELILQVLAEPSGGWHWEAEALGRRIDATARAAWLAILEHRDDGAS